MERFVISQEAYEQLLRILERPVTDLPKLKKLFERPSPWAEQDNDDA